MSVSTERTLKCDAAKVPGWEEWLSCQRRFGPRSLSKRELREAARVYRWGHIDGRDLCEVHAAVYIRGRRGEET